MDWHYRPMFNYLDSGEFLSSKNNKYHLVMEPSGKLALYNSWLWIPSNQVWSSNSAAKESGAPYTLELNMQRNDSYSVYIRSKSGAIVWDIGVRKVPTLNCLFVSDEGRIVIPTQLKLATDTAATSQTPIVAGMFQFALSCTAAVPGARCSAMATTLKTAGAIYSNLLSLTQTDRVNAVYRSFCNDASTALLAGSALNGTDSALFNFEKSDKKSTVSPSASTNTKKLSDKKSTAPPSASTNTKKCSDRLRDALGSAYPSSQWNLYGLVGVDPDYTYPQALAKQLVVSPLQWGESDITAQLNADANLWFEGDQPIGPDQTDALYLVVHELLHGMGLSSSWNAYAQDYSLDTPTTQFLSPHPLVAAAATSSTPQQFAGFLPHAIFDKFLFNTVSQMPLRVYAYLMQTCAVTDKSSGKLRALPATDFYTKFLASQVGPFAQDLYRATTTPGGIAFVFPDLVLSVANATTATSDSSGGGDTAPAAGGAQVSTGDGGASDSTNGGTNSFLRKRDSTNSTVAPAASASPDFVALYTPTTYALGSSLTHVAADATGNFILRPVTQKGATLYSIAIKNLPPPAGTSAAATGNRTMVDLFVKNNVSPLGPGVVRMLHALGYTVAPKTVAALGLPAHVGVPMAPVRRESADDEWKEPTAREGQCATSWWNMAVTG
ncbi:hypothetical protein AMAG_12846 [Allomyces macrogynus ATCC 38327]|uniref:Bulb-type lectin domain-containing protein n=1 Tax=Allomyces macrogynus (strain ATCC 38327) TaxID=578462 RepID=A0A0L0T1R5_ALLM3|nr:hypothetical protein AMAG_12846 [Allomyces macrogynus ATCC 38327]|eukprot:KNE68677.1 hypothetical protein AMAG_12846 [Allomyces macrogynus ATCC 38327]